MLRWFNNKMSSGDERGSMMVEALAMLGLISMVSPMLYKKTAERQTELADITVANQTRGLVQAVDDYIKANYADIQGGNTVGGVTYDPTVTKSYVLSFADPVLSQYVPPGFDDGNGIIDEYRVAIRLLSDGTNITRVTGMLASGDAGGVGGGSDLPRVRASRIASMIGAQGGYTKNDFAWGDPTKRTASGAQGSWALDVADYFGDAATGDTTSWRPGGGSVVATTTYTGTVDATDYLHRTGAGGDPALNTMFVDLHMANNSIDQLTNLYATNSGEMKFSDADDGGTHEFWVRGDNDTTLQVSHDIVTTQGDLTLNHSGARGGNIVLNADSSADINNGGITINRKDSVDPADSLLGNAIDVDYGTVRVGEGAVRVVEGRISNYKGSIKAYEGNIYASADSGLLASGDTGLAEYDLVNGYVGGNHGAGNIAAVSDGVNARTGNIVAIDMSSPKDLLTMNDYTFDAMSGQGNILAVGGDMRIYDTSTILGVGGGDFHTQDGNIGTDYGEIKTVEGDILTQLGDIYTNEGDILTQLGDIYTNEGDITTKLGNVNVTQGDVFVGAYTNPTGGNIVMTGGNLDISRDGIVGRGGNINVDGGTITLNTIWETGAGVYRGGDIAIKAHDPSTPSDTTDDSGGGDIYTELGSIYTSGGGNIVANKAVMDAHYASELAGNGRIISIGTKREGSSASRYEAEDIASGGGARIAGSGYIELTSENVVDGTIVKQEDQYADSGYLQARRMRTGIFFHDAQNETGVDTKTAAYQEYEVNPAFTSVMNDIKLASRGGARLSEILPDFINKGIYVLNNDVSEELNGTNLWVPKPPITMNTNADAAWKTRTGKVIGDNYTPCASGDSECPTSPYMGFIPSPQCPEGYSAMVTMTPTRFNLGQIIDNKGYTMQAPVKFDTMDPTKLHNYAFEERSPGNYKMHDDLKKFQGSAGFDNYNLLVDDGVMSGQQVAGLASHEFKSPTLGYNVPAILGDPANRITLPDLARYNGSQNLLDIRRWVVNQAGTWLALSVETYCETSGGSSFDCSSTTPGPEEFKGWSALMGFTYSDPRDPTKNVWNAWSVYYNQLAAIAHTYCYFDREDSIFNNTPVDQAYSDLQNWGGAPTNRHTCTPDNDGLDPADWSNCAGQTVNDPSIGTEWNGLVTR